VYDLERRDPSGVWRLVQRFGSYEEAASALDREIGDSQATASVRISRFDPRRRLQRIGVAVFAVLVLIVIAIWIALLASS
jgi:hypothetical protein